MTKHLSRMLLVLLAVFGMAGVAFAQQIPVDEAVRIGKLPNGLTYYIRHNETPKGQADFYIAQKVGSALEEDNQRGLAHFLEHMCFNGTTHFPGNSLREYLESIGVKFGANLNAYTSIDETVYNISNVPVARTGVQDSCLLILHDWANDLTLDPVEIDKERGVIHEEWRRSMSGQMRILENLLPVIYPGNRYGERLPIGTMEVVDNFPPQALRDYYETWYRPDQQGIVVVGDIDVDYIEGKIKEMFSDIEMPENAKERVYFPVEDNEGTIYAIGSDPEQTHAIVSYMIKTDPVPEEMKSTLPYLMMKYMINMMDGMLNQRLSDLAQTPDAPYAQASFDYGEFFVSKTKDAIDLTIVAKDGDVLGGFEAAYRELLRAARGGFTMTEYERARAEYLSRLEKAYNGRDKIQNETFVNDYVRNFIDQEPIPSIEDEYQLMQLIAGQIPVDYINSILPELVTPDNRVLMALMPQNDTFKVPTQQDFELVIARVEAEDIEAYKDNVKEEPLIPVLPTPGKVVSVVDVPQWGAKLMTLSNGVKVYVKTTDYKKDEILMTAIAMGGTSEIGDEHAVSLINLPYLGMDNGLGEYTSIDLQKYLQGKQAGVSVTLDDYTREVSGTSTVKDLPVMMELLYMTFVDYELFPDEFESNQKKIASLLAMQEANPQFIFSKTIAKELYTSPASQPISTEAVNAANREDILSIIHSCLSNAADYVFFFVGDVTVEQLAPLAEQYIATLPSDPANVRNAWVANEGREIKAGTETHTSTTAMENPQTWCAIFVQGDMPYTMENKLLASITGQILSNRLLDKVREEMGATYSIGSHCDMNRAAKFNTTLTIPFPMKPEMKDEVLAAIDMALKGMTSDVTESELAPIKEYMVKSQIEALEENGSWLGAMLGYQMNGVDTFNGRVDAINAITVADVQNFLQALLSQGNEQIVILDPAQ